MKKSSQSSKKRTRSVASSQMRSFRFHQETIESLETLTEAVNEKTNIKISATAILEMLIQDAAQKDINDVLNLIHVSGKK